MTDVDFQRFYWLTPYQLRDILIEFSDKTTESIDEIRKLCLVEQLRRKGLTSEFVECSRCRSYHTEFNNINKLCEKCEWVVHIIQWDKKYNE